MRLTRRKLVGIAFGVASAVSVLLLTSNAEAAMDEVERAYRLAVRNDSPIAYAVFLFHRLAALVWIAAEWTAAVVLILAHGELRKHFKPRGEEA